MVRITRTAALGAAALLAVGTFSATSLSADAAAPPFGVLQILSPHYSDPGAPQFADGAAVQVLHADTTRGVDTRMDTPGGAQFTLTPPDGKPLTTGVYRLVGEQPYGAKVPTLNLNSTYMTGELDINDIASDPSNGTISRFDAVLPGVGEFRFGEDQPGAVVFGARDIVFGRTFIGLPATKQVETIHNTSGTAVSIGKPAVTGTNASSFSVPGDTCPASLPAGARCSLSVGFAPRTNGPLSAALTIAVNGKQRTVPLTGSAFLGTTAMSSSGKDIVDRGKTTKVTSATSAMYVRSEVGGPTFSADGLTTGSSILQIHVEGPGNEAPIAVGTHKTQLSTGHGYLLMATVNSSGCNTTGSETVKQFTVDPATGLPDAVDLSFTQYCFDKIPQTGTLQWQARSDVTPPVAPTAVKIIGTTARTVSWKTSASADAKSVVARLVQGDGSNATPQSGVPLTVVGTSAVIPQTPADQRYTVAVFAVDGTGNASKAASASFGSAPVIVMAPGRPAITSVTPGPSSVTVAFTPPSSDGGLPITSYEVSTINGSFMVTGTSSPLTISGLPDNTYQVRVQAINAAGKSVGSYSSQTFSPQ